MKALLKRIREYCAVCFGSQLFPPTPPQCFWVQYVMVKEDRVK